MGFLSRLIKSKEGLAKETITDKETRKELWEEHISVNYPKRQAFAKQFSPRDIDNTLGKLDRVESLLAELEDLVSKDIVTIENEEKTEDEIIKDLKILASQKSKDHSEKLIVKIATEHHNQKNFFIIFIKIHRVLKLELHIIRLVRKKLKSRDHSNIRNLLEALFTLVYHQESKLYRIFEPEAFADRLAGDQISSIARSFILGEEFGQQKKSAEAKFIAYMVELFGSDDPGQYYVRLAESVFSSLSERAKLMSKDSENYYEWIENFERLLDDNGVLPELIRKFHRKTDDEEIRLITAAFRKSFNLNHFEELIMHLYQSNN